MNDDLGERLRTTLSRARQQVSAWWNEVRLELFVTPPPGEPEPEETPTAPPGSALYQHTAHTHRPRNINRVHKSEQQAAGFNTRVAVWLTKNVGTMQCAYVFAGIGIGSLIGVFTNNVFLAALFGSISSYFLQLVLLPVLSVGQNVLSRHQELQADELYKNSQRSFHDIEEIMSHLAAQDEELLKQTRLLLRLAGEPEPEPAPAALAPTEPATRGRRAKQP